MDGHRGDRRTHLVLQHPTPRLFAVRSPAQAVAGRPQISCPLERAAARLAAAANRERERERESVPRNSHRPLAGQTIVITGAASGIGRALALRLAAHGSPVAIVDQNADGLEETAAGIDTGKLSDREVV